MRDAVNPGIDHRVLRESFSQFPSGVVALAAAVEDDIHVLVASAFSVGVSLDPPLVAVFVKKISTTWSSLGRAKRIGVSVLSAEHARVCRQLAGRDKSARLKGVVTRITDSGAVRIEGAAAWFECAIFDVHPTGDHDAVFLHVHNVQLTKEATPLVFHGSRFTALTSDPAQSLFAS